MPEEYAIRNQMEMRNDPFYNQLYRDGSMATEESQRRWWKNMAADPYNQLHIIESKVNAHFDDDGEIDTSAFYWTQVGVGGIVKINPIHGTGELAFQILPTNYKQSIASVSGIVDLLLDYGFGTFRLERIWVETILNSTTESFIRIDDLVECGFTHEGIMRGSYFKNGVQCDSAISSMLRHEYYTKKGRYDENNN